jgi:hypothetical protein
MVEEPESLMLRSLRRIEAGMDGLRDDNREIKSGSVGLSSRSA